MQNIKPAYISLNTKITNPITANEQEAYLCEHNSFLFNKCKKDPLMDKWITRRPSEYKVHQYCSFRVNMTYTFANLRFHFKLNSTRKSTVVVIGNSYAYFNILGILTAIRQSKINASKVYVIRKPGCTVLASFVKHEPDCDIIKGSYDKFLRRLKPDALILSER